MVPYRRLSCDRYISKKRGYADIDSSLPTPQPKMPRDRPRYATVTKSVACVFAERLQPARARTRSYRKLTSLPHPLPSSEGGCRVRGTSPVESLFGCASDRCLAYRTGAFGFITRGRRGDKLIQPDAIRSYSPLPEFSTNHSHCPTVE